MQLCISVRVPQFSEDDIVLTVAGRDAARGSVVAGDVVELVAKQLSRRFPTMSMALSDQLFARLCDARDLAERCVLFDLRDEEFFDDDDSEPGESLSSEDMVELYYNPNSGYFAELELRIVEDTNEVAANVASRLGLAERDELDEAEEQTHWPKPVHVDAVNWAPLLTIAVNDDDDHVQGAGSKSAGGWFGAERRNSSVSGVFPSHLQFDDTPRLTRDDWQMRYDGGRARHLSTAPSRARADVSNERRLREAPFQVLGIEEEVDEGPIDGHVVMKVSPADPSAMPIRPSSSFLGARSLSGRGTTTTERSNSLVVSRDEPSGDPRRRSSIALEKLRSFRKLSAVNHRQQSRATVDSAAFPSRKLSMNSDMPLKYLRSLSGGSSRLSSHRLSERADHDNIGSEQRFLMHSSGNDGDDYSSAKSPQASRRLNAAALVRPTFSVPISPHPSSIHLKTQRAEPTPTRRTAVSNSGSPLPVSPSRGLLTEFRGVPDAFGNDHGQNETSAAPFLACASFLPEWNHSLVCCRCGESYSRHRVRVLNERLQEIAKSRTSP